ncbi:MAG: hypothetical protein ASARMPREDX12_001604 [Alectoria sarmentosa]|nr:MAG: hypothetical protein ASARMPREDX12_001604 [Alectoria sarmentosa]
MQKLVDEMNAEEDAEKARKEVEMDTPENRQKAREAEVAERKRKRIDFHFNRAIPRFMEEGWKHLRQDMVDEEIRVYTLDNERRRFWGIKPAGIGMYDFWEQVDPEVGRYDDRIALTWANPLVPPPVSMFDENKPLIWAGKGLNPDIIPLEPPIAIVPLPTNAAISWNKRQKTPEINPTHRVSKSTTPSPKADMDTRNSLVDNGLATFSRSRGRPAAKANLASKKDIVPHSKRPRGRPAAKVNLASEKNGLSSLPKRPRGRPATKVQPAANSEDAVSYSLKRPRGRPPGKGKSTEKPSKPKKTSTVKGSRITKSQQTKRPPSVPSTHKMRTRRGGPAELLQLP